MEMFRLIGGSNYPPTEAELRAKVERAVRRSYRPDGFARQLIAIQTAPNRVLKLRRVRAPTLRSTLSAINDNYLNVQHDIVETIRVSLNS